MSGTATKSTIERIPTDPAELAALFTKCSVVHCCYGTGDLLWDTTKPLPEAVIQLGIMRGIQPPANLQGGEDVNKASEDDEIMFIDD